MRWFVLCGDILMLGGLTIGGYVTMIWLAQTAAPQPTVAQAELRQTARWLARRTSQMT